jgi:hypothetical protein
MQLRSGTSFAPYDLGHAFHPRTPPDSPISTLVSVEPLIQGAVALEDLRFEQGGDDSEGLGVMSRPLTPLTEIDSEEVDEAETVHPSSGTQSTGSSKKRRNAGAKKRRAKKRVRLASSGHRPHAYVANPSLVTHRAEELKPLRAPVDAMEFPASGSGSWVGRRK